MNGKLMIEISNKKIRKVILWKIMAIALVYLVFYRPKLVNYSFASVSD